MSSMIGMGSKTPKGYSQYSLPTMSPEGQDLWSMLYGSLKGPMAAGISNLGKMASGDESYFQQLEKPAMTQFQQGMGQLGSRFSGMGMGSQKSSGFQLAGSSMAQDLSERLQSQRMGLQQQAIHDLMGMSQHLLSTPTQQYGLAQKPQGFWEQLLPSLIGAGGQIGGAYLGGLPMASAMKMFAPQGQQGF